MNISPGFTGKELQELQGLRLRVAERVGEFEWWRPSGHTNDKTLWEGMPQGPKPSLLHLCVSRLTFVPSLGNSQESSHVFQALLFCGDVFHFGEGYSHIKRCDLRFSTSMPAKFHLFWEVSLPDLVFERWFTSTSGFQKKRLKGVSISWIDSTPTKKNLHNDHFKFRKEKNVPQKIFAKLLARPLLPLLSISTSTMCLGPLFF